MKFLRGVMWGWLFAAVSAAGVQAQEVMDIADARTMELGTVVTVTGTSTCGQEFGNIRYFQDGTGGLAAIQQGLTSGISRHDSITITGTLSSFNGLLQLSPVSNLVIHGQASVQIAPVTVSPGDISEETEALLVHIPQSSFSEGGQTFSGNTSYSVTSGGESVNAYIRNGHPLIGSVIPAFPVSLTAISSQFSFSGSGGYQILPRDEGDFLTPNSINIISAVTAAPPQPGSFSLSWTTDVAGTSECFYTSHIDGEGLTQNVFTSTSASVQHSITVEGADPGEVYFVQPFSAADGDTAFGAVRALATVSNSSGEIGVFFNGSVDHSHAYPDDNLAIVTDLRQKAIEVINNAEQTISMAAYNINDVQIVAALNSAHLAGVEVRYIAEGQTANTALANLHPGIPILIREDGLGSGMHNKFIVTDYASVDNSYVLTGSTNFTQNQLNSDYNHMIVIQDRALAKAFTIEFNEMFGSSGATPDQEKSRFGPDKTDNTPRDFIIGGRPTELYFSPSDGTNNGIVNAIENAEGRLHFSLLVFTMSSLAQAVINLHNASGTDVRGMIDQINSPGSEFANLQDNGVDVLHHNVSGAQLHHKYAIVDYGLQGAAVITGSHNWSASANNVNDENLLIIRDTELANIFFQEWSARRNELPLSTDDRPVALYRLYPNPTSGKVYITALKRMRSRDTVHIFDLSGRQVAAYPAEPMQPGEMTEIDLSGLPNGSYVLKFAGSGVSEKVMLLR